MRGEDERRREERGEERTTEKKDGEEKTGEVRRGQAYPRLTTKHSCLLKTALK